MAAFAQDSWKATSQLTVNYGVRWDRIRPWQEKFNQLQTLVKGEQSQVFPGAPQGLVFPGDPGVPRIAGPGAQRLCAPPRHRVDAGLRRAFAAASSPARPARPASASATASSTPPTKGFRRAS